MIGIFDSGAGGLTVLRALRNVFPSADVLYFGDCKNAPYGNKTRAELTTLTVQALSLLEQYGADRAISACNSVSASLVLSLIDVFPMRIDSLIEMVGPTVAALRAREGDIVIAATKATIDSGLYQTGFHLVGKSIVPLAIPGLAGLIEEGASSDVMRATIHDAVDRISWEGISTLVLACTHFPLVSEYFREVLPPSVTLIDPAEAVAERAVVRWWPREAGNGTTRFLLSAPSATFTTYVSRLFPHEHFKVEVVA